MKRRILFSTILIIFTFISTLKAQNCGTPNSGVNQEFGTLRNSSCETSVCINVFFHIVKKTDGSGGFNVSNVDLIVNDLNEFYNPHNIYIHKQGVDFINNSYYYDLPSIGFNGLIGQNNVTNAINFYLVNSAPYQGRAEDIPSKNLVVSNSFALSPTSSHELGHCLNLWHTHHGSGNCGDTLGCAEAISGVNWSTCGDFVMDTPADPCIQNQLNSNCEYVGGGGYTPDTANIMSYGGICRNRFTSGQGERMLSAILGSSLLQQVISTSCEFATLTGDDFICSNSSSTYLLCNAGNNVIWNVSSNLNIVSSSNSSITVQPLNSNTSASGFIEAILPNQIKRKNIWIGKPNILVAKFDSGELLSHGNTNNVFKTAQIKTNITVGGANSVTWSKVSSSHVTTWSQQGNDVSFYLWATNHTATFKVTITNECGTFSRNYSFKAKICSGNNDPCDPSFTISQNPVDDDIEIIMIPAPCDPVLSKNGTDLKRINNSSATLYDLYGKQMVSKKPADGFMNIQNIKSGVYILIITNDDFKKSYRILVK